MKSKLFIAREDETSLIEAPLDNEGVTELETAAMENFARTAFDIDDTDRLISAVVAIESLINNKKAGVTGQALEGYKHVGIMGSVGTDMDPSLLIDPSLSLEALASRRDNLLSTIGRAFSQISKSLADGMQYSFSILEFQTGRIEKLKEQLKEIPSEKRIVTVKDRKYLHHGYNGAVVTSGGEYLKKYSEVTDVLGKLSEGLVLIAAEGFFRFFKNISVIFNSDKREEMLNKQFEVLTGAWTKVVKSTGLKVEKSKIRSDLHASEVMLGQVQIEASMPKKGDANIDNYVSFGLHIERVNKFERPAVLSRSVAMELSKKEIETLLKDSEELLVKLNDMREELTGYFASNSIAELMTLNYSVYFDLITKTGRLYLHVARMIGYNTASLYNVGFGNIKQALTITEAYIGK